MDVMGIRKKSSGLDDITQMIGILEIVPDGNDGDQFIFNSINQRNLAKMQDAHRTALVGHLLITDSTVGKLTQLTNAIMNPGLGTLCCLDAKQRKDKTNLLRHVIQRLV